MNTSTPIIEARDLTVGYGSYVVQKDLNFTINRQDVFIIMGPSGCGKSTLLRVLVGLLQPTKGQVLYRGQDFWAGTESERQKLLSGVGLLFQSGALWSSMTLAENVALPLQRYTKLSSAEIREQTSLKLALVGLAGFEDYYPSEISGGMRKRAGLARALAMDPEIVFFDEPSAGLDPVSAALLDELILELKENMGMTVVVVTHDLDSIFTIGNNSVFLDAATHTMITGGDPHVLRCDQAHPDIVRRIPLMSKSANKTLIGAFVVGATALLLLAIAVFGSGKLFQTTSRYVLFFDGSISGLSVGSPVLFRGVPVGRVVEIRLTGDLDNLVFQTPVFIELNKKDEGRFSVSDGDISKKEYLDRLVSHGLRATLATQSLLTGQLMIEMDFYPRSQIPYPIKEVKEYDDVPEIPTIPSQFDNILQTLTTLPYDDIASNVLDITEGVKKILSNSGTEQLIGHIDKLVVQLQDIGTNLDKTLTSIRGLAEPYTKLAQDTDKRLSAALEQASHVLSRIDNVAKETEMTVVSARGVVSKNSTTVIELNQAIREITEAARAVRVFANTLERNPEAVLRGKVR